MKRHEVRLTFNTGNRFDMAVWARIEAVKNRPDYMKKLFYDTLCLGQKLATAETDRLAVWFDVAGREEGSGEGSL